MRNNIAGTKLALAVPLLALAASTTAWDLSWQPRLEIGTRATDNLRAFADDEEAAWGFDTGGGLDLKAESDRWRSVVRPAFNFRRFVIGEDADADEYEVRTQNQWSFIERATLGLDFDYIRDSTLTTELADAGVLNAVVNRDTYNIRPNLNIAVDERTMLSTSFFYSDVSFEDRPGIFFRDYDFKQFSTSLTHEYSPRISLFATGYISEFETPDDDGRSLNYGGLAGLTYRHTESLEGEFGVGYQQSEIDFNTQQFTGNFQFVFDPVSGQIVAIPIFATVRERAVENGPIARASLRKSFDHTRARIDYSRAVSPSALGAQSISDDIALIVDHRLSERFSLNMRGAYNMRSVESDQITNARANLNRNQVLFSSALRYRYSETITLAANYRFFWNELVDVERDVYNNALFFTVTYLGDPQFYRGF